MTQIWELIEIIASTNIDKSKDNIIFTLAPIPLSLASMIQSLGIFM